MWSSLVIDLGPFRHQTRNYIRLDFNADFPLEASASCLFVAERGLSVKEDASGAQMFEEASQHLTKHCNSKVEESSFPRQDSYVLDRCEYDPGLGVERAIRHIP